MMDPPPPPKPQLVLAPPAPDTAPDALHLDALLINEHGELDFANLPLELERPGEEMGTDDILRRMIAPWQGGARQNVPSHPIRKPVAIPTPLAPPPPRPTPLAPNPTPSPFFMQPPPPVMQHNPPPPRPTPPNNQPLPNGAVKYDDAFIRTVAEAYEALKMDPNRDELCASRNPAQVIGQRYSISEWTVYRHYKRAVDEGWVDKTDAKRAKTTSMAPARRVAEELPPLDLARASQQLRIEKPFPGLTLPAVQQLPARPSSVPSASLFAAPGLFKPSPSASMPPPSAAPVPRTRSASASLPAASVRIVHVSGQKYEGFMCRVVMKEQVPSYTLTCRLPEVRSAEDVAVRTHDNGQIVLIIDPVRFRRALERGGDAADTAPPHPSPNPPLPPPTEPISPRRGPDWPVKMILQLPSSIIATSAQAVVTPSGLLVLSVDIPIMEEGEEEGGEGVGRRSLGKRDASGRHKQ